MKQSRLQTYIIIGAVVIVGLLLAIYFTGNDSAKEITNFDECAEAGNPIQTSYPGRCTDKDGNTYTQDIADDKDSEAKLTPPSTDDSTKAPDLNNPKKETIDISVYFAKKPESNDDFAYTTAVSRSSSRTDIGSYALEQLATGPNATESERGLFSPLQGIFTGKSNCDGGNLTLSVADKTATLKFCRTVKTNGVGDDARIKATVDKTLEQFSTVDKVKILTRDGACFGDASGQNKCLAE